MRYPGSEGRGLEKVHHHGVFLWWFRLLILCRSRRGVRAWVYRSFLGAGGDMTAWLVMPGSGEAGSGWGSWPVGLATGGLPSVTVRGLGAKDLEQGR